MCMVIWPSDKIDLFPKEIESAPVTSYTHYTITLCVMWCLVVISGDHDLCLQTHHFSGRSMIWILKCRFEVPVDRLRIVARIIAYLPIQYALNPGIRYFRLSTVFYSQILWMFVLNTGSLHCLVSESLKLELLSDIMMRKLNNRWCKFLSVSCHN